MHRVDNLELKFKGWPEDRSKDMFDVLVAKLGKNNADGEHGEAGVVLEPVALVPRRQATITGDDIVNTTYLQIFCRLVFERSVQN